MPADEHEILQQMQPELLGQAQKMSAMRNETCENVVLMLCVVVLLIQPIQENIFFNIYD